MKKYIVLLLVMTLGMAGYAQTTTAPKKHKKHSVVKKKMEKVVVNSNRHNTIVEIKNDKIYVDGEMVSTIKNAKKEDHKIVIKHKGGGNKKEGEEAKEEKAKASEPELSNESGAVIITETPFERIPPNTTIHTGNGHALLGVYSSSTPVDGAYITRVMSNSPAESAGLQQTDIITRVDQKNINTSEELVETIATYKPGDNVIITYNRDGNLQQARVVLGEKQAEEQQEQMHAYEHNWQNNDARDNNENKDENRNNYSYNYYGSRRKPVQLGISASDGRRPRGVYLDEVKPGSPAAEAGLQQGDIITRIDDQRVRNAYEMQELLSYPGIGNMINIEYRHNGARMQTEVRIENKNNGDQDYRNHRRMDYENERGNNYNYER